jgi:aldose 1-epimerase
MNSPALSQGPVRPVTISSGGSRATIDPVGAHVAEVLLGGVRVIKPSEDGSQTHGGIAVLIPYAGRVRHGRYRFEGADFQLPVRKDGHAIHGFAKDTRWKVLEKGPDSATLGCRLKGVGYPSTIEVTMSYSVGRNTFRTGCTVRNAGSRDCPLVVGFHPYFLGEEWTILTDGPAYRYRLRDGFFPTGEREPYSFDGVGPRTRLDDCFEVPGTVLFRSEGRELKIGRRRMPYLVVYDGKYAEERSVAIEPYSALPDAYNNGIGLKVLKRGRVFTCGYWFILGSSSRPLEGKWS